MTTTKGRKLGPLSPEVKKKVSEGLKRYYATHGVSQGAREKIRKSKLGKKRDAHTIQRLREAHTGTNSVQWKGDKALPDTGRTRAEGYFECPQGKERHHIDGNPLNNNPANVEFLTRREHQIKDGRLQRLKERMAKSDYNFKNPRMRELAYQARKKNGFKCSQPKKHPLSLEHKKKISESAKKQWVNS